jgi:hypothetical protein
MLIAIPDSRSLVSNIADMPDTHSRWLILADSCANADPDILHPVHISCSHII